MSVFSSPDGLRHFAEVSNKKVCCPDSSDHDQSPFPLLLWHWAVLVTPSNSNIYQTFQSLPSAIWFLPGSCQFPSAGLAPGKGCQGWALPSACPLHTSHGSQHKGAPSPLTLTGPPAVPITELGGITELLPREKLFFSDTCEQSGAISHFTPILMMLPSVIITYFFCKILSKAESNRSLKAQGSPDWLDPNCSLCLTRFFLLSIWLAFYVASLNCARL